jgi:hypothetical protein
MLSLLLLLLVSCQTELHDLGLHFCHVGMDLRWPSLAPITASVVSSTISTVGAPTIVPSTSATLPRTSAASTLLSQPLEAVLLDVACFATMEADAVAHLPQYHRRWSFITTITILRRGLIIVVGSGLIVMSGFVVLLILMLRKGLLIS